MRPGRRVSGRSIAVPAILALTAAGTAVVLAPSPPASATPVIRQVRIASTDWVSGAVGGIGSGKGAGKGTITISGIHGKVTGAWLSWNGIGHRVSAAAFEGTYDNPAISVNGKKVVGISQGESGSNCWGLTASSRTYLANVTKIARVTRNGAYHLKGLGKHGDANGANLIVAFRDADPSNNQDLYLYYGNDTDADGYPGEDLIWKDTLDRIAYAGGPVSLQLAVADGQNFGPADDDALTVTGQAGPLVFDDTPANHGLWDGTTVRDAGHSRATGTAGPGSLFDLETFDVTTVFDSAPQQTLDIGTGVIGDCHSLTMAALSVNATGHQPAAPLTVSVSPASVKEGTRRAHCHQRHCPRFTSMKFQVLLSRAVHRRVTVKLNTKNGTATAPSDFVRKKGKVTIRAHHTSATFTVHVRRDKVPEIDELFYAVIRTASVDVATRVATGTIRNDDKSLFRSPAAPSLGARGGGV